jgi:hypothetical protein
MTTRPFGPQLPPSGTMLVSANLHRRYCCIPGIETTMSHLGVARQQYCAVAQCCVAVHKQRAWGQLAAESGATQIYGAARGSQSFLQIRQASRV